MYPNTLNLTFSTISTACFRVLNQLVCCLASIAMAAVSVMANPVMAQTSTELTDVQPPVIEMNQIEEGFAGESQAFEAIVTDDQELLAVLLFHRLSGEENFNSVDMSQLDGTNIYTVSIPSSAENLQDIEYFVQAEDTAGNRSIKGFTFDPLVRKMAAPRALSAVVDPESVSANTSDTTTGITPEAASIESNADGSELVSESVEPIAEQKSSSGRGRLIWGVVGLLVVAGVAVALSQDDDSDDAPNPITLNSDGGRALSIQW